jgi:hypothetical protein
LCYTENSPVQAAEPYTGTAGTGCVRISFGVRPLLHRKNGPEKGSLTMNENTAPTAKKEYRAAFARHCDGKKKGKET